MFESTKHIEEVLPVSARSFTIVQESVRRMIGNAIRRNVSSKIACDVGKLR
jgi:hypothetical protein